MSVKKNKTSLPPRRFILVFFLIVLVFNGGIIFIASRLNSARSAKAQTKDASVPAYNKSLDEARPLPATLDPVTFKGPSVVRSYEAAKRIPEVLAQQPCYCRCDRHGHRSLLDCFRTNHAASCLICMKEALLADQMDRAGKSADEIRSAIIRGDWKSIQLDGRM